MNERDFVNKKRADWDRLSALIAKAGGVQGVRVLSREEVRELGPLYRRASSDLARARLHATTSDLVVHLNGLVGRAHALMFEAETSRSPVQSVAHFYLHEFPALLQKRVWYFLGAVAISVIGGVFAYWLVFSHPDKINLFIPEGDMKRSLDIWKSGHVASEASAAQSGLLFANNMRVGLIAFGLGGFFGIPTTFLLFTNGALLGAFSAVMTQYHTHGSFWPGILPHGVAELTAIFICGASGYLIGLSFIFPGRHTRIAAFKRYGIEGVKLALGTIPMFVFAAIIEGMFSHLPVSTAVRYAFAAINGILWYLYLFLPRPRALVSGDPELSGN